MRNIKIQVCYFGQIRGFDYVKIQGSAVSDSFGNTTAVVEIGAPGFGASEKNLRGNTWPRQVLSGSGNE
jgi:hypothetical protein